MKREYGEWKKRRTGEYVWHIAALTIIVYLPDILEDFFLLKYLHSPPDLSECASLLVDGGSPTIHATERYTKDTLKLALPNNSPDKDFHEILKIEAH